ncbi:MAG: hypothetical protein H8D65_01610 [Spirochaetes bacterium]|nr:hypothetical protein [Spirochaetota bacterium]
MLKKEGLFATESHSRIIPSSWFSTSVWLAGGGKLSDIEFEVVILLDGSETISGFPFEKTTNYAQQSSVWQWHLGDELYIPKLK